MAIGGLIGGVIDPTVIEGPHIGDGSNQSSAEGVPIPWIIGTGLVQGNIVQKSERREVKKEDDGKGGPVQVTYEAHQDFAIMICESSETRLSTMLGVLMVRCNGKIVYDVRPGKNFGAENAKFLENVTFYNGDEDQMPDPTLEAITGVGNTPAYRGVFLAVFRDINLTQYGDAIPTYEWVMVSDGTVTTSAPILVSGTDGPTDSKAYYGSHGAWTAIPHTSLGQDYRVAYGNGRWVLARQANSAWSPDLVTWTPGTMDPLAGILNDIAYGNGVFIAVGSGKFIARSTDDGVSFSAVSPPVGLNAGFNCIAYGDGRWVVGGSGASDIYSDDDGATWTAYGSLFPYRMNDVAYAGGQWVAVGGAATIDNGKIIRSATAGPTWTTVLSGLASSAWLVCGDGAGLWVVICVDGSTFYSDDDAVSFTAGPAVGEASAATTLVHDGVNFVYCESNGFDESTSRISATGESWSAQVNIGLEDITSASSRCDGLSGTPIPDAPGWYIDENGNVVGCGGETSTSTPVTVANAIARICARGDVPGSQIDVSEVDQTLLGYTITSEYTAADCLRPLLTAYSLYGSEYDQKIHFRKRGDDVDIVINPDDLIGEGDETDDMVRGQQKEYPRKVLLSYIDPDQDYATRQQARQALTPDVRSVGEQTLQVSVVMEYDDAARLADVFYKRTRAAVEGRRKLSVPYGTTTDCYLQLVAGEPVAYDGKRYIVDQMLLEDGQINIDLAYDRQSAWTSDVSGIPALPPTPPPSTLSGPTIFAVMNLPVLIDAHDKLGVYIAAAGMLGSWRGCLVQISRDDGATWATALPEVLEASIIGSLVDPLPLAPESGTDVTNTLHVTVYGGELESITETQLLNDGNPCAIVRDDGTSEIIQFQTASLVDDGEYNLTTLTRGRLDTTPAAHEAGARFVQLESVYFLELTIADIGRDLLFRPVAFGTSPDSNPSYALTFDPAVSQTEWMPEFLTGSRTGDDLNVSVVPRHRLGTDVMPVPSVNFDGFRWTFTVGADSYTTDTAGPTYTLTEAQQIATFGSAQPAIDVAVSQLNRITGAGPEQEATL